MTARREFASGGVMLAASFVGLSVGISSLFFYTMGIFIRPLQAEFGWSRATLSLAVLISGVVLAGASPIIGRLVDRAGVRRVVSVSMPAFALATFGMSFLPGNLTVYLCAFTLVCLAGAGTSPVVFTRLVAAHFKAHRGLALGLLLSGTGVAATLAPAFFTPFIAEHGWREGYRLLAAISITALPIVLMGLGGEGKAARAYSAHAGTRIAKSGLFVFLRDWRFRLMFLSFFGLALAIGGLIVHFVPMLLDGGMSAATAGRTAGLIGIAVIFGRIGAGALIDRIHAPFVAAAMLAAAALGCALLAASGGTQLAGVAAVLVGLAMGAEVDLIGFLVARYLGLSAYGSAYGILYGAFVAGAAIGPFLVGLSFDVTGSYQIALICAALLLSGAAILLSRLGPYPLEVA